MMNFNSYYEMGGNSLPIWLFMFFLVLVLWNVFWKGLALWHSVKRDKKWWFVILLVVNTFGILEIIYLFLVLKMKFKDLFKK